MVPRRPVAYFDELQEDVSRNNSLVVLGRGLGMAQALASFVVHNVEPNMLILGLNITRTCGAQLIWPAIDSVSNIIDNVDHSLLLPRFINADYSVKDRKEIYDQGGFLIVTSNVLVHDFLHSSIPAERISGIVVFSAEGVREGTNNHFALKLFRMRNRSGFVKAFSEVPNRLTGGFHNLEKLMHRLYLSRVCLWPRFHKAIKASLRDHTPDLVDLSVGLTPKMSALLSALRNVTRMICADLRSATKLIDVSNVYSEDTADSRKLRPMFDLIVERQVAEIGGKIGWRARSLASDLTMLRRLLTDVLELNSVLLYQKLVTLRHTAPRSSHWLIRREAQSALVIARSRVWTRKNAKDAGNDGSESAKSFVVSVLEQPPKWKALKAVMDEIRNDVKAAGRESNLGRLIIFVKEKRLIEEVESVLRNDCETFLRKQFKETFPAVAEKVEEDAVLIKEHQDKHRQITLTQLVRSDTRPENSAAESDSSKLNATRKAITSIAHKPRKRPRTAESKFNKFQIEDAGLGSCGKKDFEICVPVDNDIEIVVWCCERLDSSGRGWRTLNEFNPAFIVLYNPDVAIVRQTELYKASHPGYPVRLYLLTHTDYLEAEQFDDYVSREKNAFRNLIRERATMAIHVDQEGRRGDDDIFLTQTLGNGIGSTNVAAGSSGMLILDSRKENSGSSSRKSRIIVDIRELRSKLPMMIHKTNVTVVPATLEVGDFVLSKRIAVERKSIPDLYSSLGSGRLFSQAEALSLHYEFPCLLIEFQSNALLSLSATGGGVRDELGMNCITSKMVLVMQHFPALRILWARGASDAVTLFMALKEKEEEPDEATAMNCGVDSANPSENEFNPGPKALLRSLPGIDGKNMMAVMRKVKNVAELAQMTKEEMVETLGSEEKASLLHEYVNKKPDEVISTY